MAREFMSTGEVGEVLGVSDDTVRRYVAEGLLRAQAIAAGRRGRVTLRIHQRDLDEFRARYVRDTSADDWER